MIVCSCNVLSDHDVRSAVTEAEPRYTSQVYGCLGCNAQCGRCARTIRRIMNETLGMCPKSCACCNRQAAAQDAAASLEPALAATA